MSNDKLLHSVILGRGRPLVVMHGFLGMADNWISLGRRWAAEGFEVHLLDLRNHGKSFWDDRFDYEVLTEDLARYIAHHRLDEPHILGHSLGGKIAMWDAIQNRPGRGRYVILDIAPRYYPPRHGFIFEAFKQVDPARYRSREEVEKALAPYIPQRHIRLFVMKNLKRLPGGGFAWKLNWPVLEKSMETIGRALPADAVSFHPALFLRGDRSDYIHEADMPLIRRHFPGAEIRTVPGAGHWLHAERPDDIFVAVKDFLTGP